MMYIIYKDGSWIETESDLQASEYASSPDWLVTICSTVEIVSDISLEECPLCHNTGEVCDRCDKTGAYKE